MTTVMSSPFAGAEMMTFFAPAVDVTLGLLRLGEQAGRFDDVLDAEFLPRQRGRAFLDGQALDLVAVDDEDVVLGARRRLFSLMTVPSKRPWVESYFSR